MNGSQVPPHDDPPPDQITLEEVEAVAEKKQGKTANDVLIDHAARMWESERENAARIQERLNLTGAAIVALLGLGLFSFVWTFQAPSHPLLSAWLVIVIHALLILAVIAFAVSLGRLYSGPTASGTATECLELDESDLGDPTK